MAWRLAGALMQLRSQVNGRWPHRNKGHDGSIGDARHASRASDHNPHVKDGAMGVVTAIDITDDPKHGPTIKELAEVFRLHRDHRLKYVICDGRIFSSTKYAWKWRRYAGHPHDKHIHVSVRGTKRLYDDKTPWRLK